MRRSESGVLRAEGHGTWVNWAEEDPERLLRLIAEASELLNRYIPIPADEGTDSDLATSARSQYMQAVCRRALAGLHSWHEYTTYCEDFGDSDLGGSQSHASHIFIVGTPLAIILGLPYKFSMLSSRHVRGSSGQFTSSGQKVSRSII